MLRAGGPDFLLTVLDAPDNPFRDIVDAAGNTVRLRQHLTGPRKRNKLSNICARKAVNALVIITRHIHAVAVVFEIMGHNPLQSGEVLCLVQKHNLQPWREGWIFRELHHHIGEVLQAVLFFEAFILFIDVLKLIVSNGEPDFVIGVLWPVARVPCKINRSYNGMVRAHNGKALILDDLYAIGGEIDASFFSKLFHLLGAKHLRTCHAKGSEGQTVQRPEINKIILRVQIKTGYRPVAGLVSRLPGEGKVTNVIG